MYSHHEGSVARKLDQHHITSFCKPPVDWELGWIIVSTLKPFFFGRTDFFEAWINLCWVQQLFNFVGFSTSDSNQFSDSTMDSSFRPRFSTFQFEFGLKFTSQHPSFQPISFQFDFHSLHYSSFLFGSNFTFVSPLNTNCPCWKWTNGDEIGNIFCKN